MKSVLQSAIENQKHNSQVTCRSYSGRGMFGKTCLGVEAPNLEQFFYVLVDCLVEMNDQRCRKDIAECISGIKTDSMGKDIIVYFPSIEYFQDDDNEQDY